MDSRIKEIICGIFFGSIAAIFIITCHWYVFVPTTVIFFILGLVVISKMKNGGDNTISKDDNWR